MRKKLKVLSQGLLCVTLYMSTNNLQNTSLVKLDDDRLQALLDEIQTMRKFQT